MRRAATKKGQMTAEGCQFEETRRVSLFFSLKRSHIFDFSLKKRMKLLFAVATSLLVALAPNPVKGGNPNPHLCETDDPPGIKCHTSVSP